MNNKTRRAWKRLEHLRLLVAALPKRVTWEMMRHWSHLPLA
jgi:hypothetical protein